MKAFSILLLTASVSAAAFVISTKSHPKRRDSMFAIVESNRRAAFDFSSPLGWEAFYQADPDTAAVEWHSSVPFSDQIALVPKGSSCLIIGCGNSALPLVLHESHEGATSITCLDSSATCLEQLRRDHDERLNNKSNNKNNMSYVVGDAVRLKYTLDQTDEVASSYNVILDKGLTDAIMCGEGWNGPLVQLLTEASSVLTLNGSYILICYKLSASTREFLEDIGNKVGLSWSFDVEGSNGRVSVSVATRQ